MAWYDKILPTIAAVAPTIASVLGGPLAGMGVNALMTALGVATEEEAQKAVVGMSPEVAAQVRKADQDFAIKMRDLDIDIERIAKDDRASARAREMAVKDPIPGILACALTIGFFGLLVLMSFLEVPSANREMLNIMLGSLGTAWVTAMAYYFGSSTGSKEKNNIIGTYAKKA